MSRPFISGRHVGHLRNSPLIVTCHMLPASNYVCRVCIPVGNHTWPGGIKHPRDDGLGRRADISTVTLGGATLTPANQGALT